MTLCCGSHPRYVARLATLHHFGVTLFKIWRTDGNIRISSPCSLCPWKFRRNLNFQVEGHVPLTCVAVYPSRSFQCELLSFDDIGRDDIFPLYSHCSHFPVLRLRCCNSVNAAVFQVATCINVGNFTIILLLLNDRSATEKMMDSETVHGETIDITSH